MLCWAMDVTMTSPMVVPRLARGSETVRHDAAWAGVALTPRTIGADGARFRSVAHGPTARMNSALRRQHPSFRELSDATSALATG
jgi:hypothetical protein